MKLGIKLIGNKFLRKKCDIKKVVFEEPSTPELCKRSYKFVPLNNISALPSSW